MVLDGACDDGNQCTVNDVCTQGICLGEIDACECLNKSDCAGFEDGNLCNGTLACLEGFCSVDPESIPSCVAEGENPCVTGGCNPFTGLCETTPANEGATCTDGDPCSTGDRCLNGLCVPKETTDCDDGNPCTLDSCDSSAGGCVTFFHTDPCDDGNPCTAGDVCSEGVCSGLISPGCDTSCSGDEDCEDEDPCTANICNPFGVCSYPPNGLCSCNTPEDCEDGNPCTDHTCTDSICSSVNNSSSCEDGDPCTSGDTCLVGDCISGPPLTCDDGNPCTANTCFEGECQTIFLLNPCEDGNLCTSGDMCMQGICSPGAPVTCDDQNDCTLDSCDPVEGCSTTSLDGASCSPKNNCGLQGTCNEIVCEVIGDEGTCCSEDAHCLSNVPCLEGVCNDLNGTCTYLPITCENPEEQCSLSYCDDGACFVSPSLAANEMYSITTSDFNNGAATGWFMESTHPDVFWSPVLGTGVGGGYGLYMGNPLTLNYDGGELTATALSPPVAVPAQGGQVEYRLLKSVGDANCPLDALQVTAVNVFTGTEVPIQTLCGSTVGFDTFQFSLDDFGGQIVRLKFLFTTGTAEDNEGYGIVIDNLRFEIRAPASCCESGIVCDDGNPCTNDTCGEGGLCQNSACGGYSVP